MANAAEIYLPSYNGNNLILLFMHLRTTNNRHLEKLMATTETPSAAQLAAEFLERYGPALAAVMDVLDVSESTAFHELRGSTLSIVAAKVAAERVSRGELDRTDDMGPADIVLKNMLTSLATEGSSVQQTRRDLEKLGMKVAETGDDAEIDRYARGVAALQLVEEELTGQERPGLAPLVQALSRQFERREMDAATNERAGIDRTRRLFAERVSTARTGFAAGKAG